MASGRKTLALYLTIALESEFLNATQIWVRMFLNTPGVFSADICCRHTKQEEENQKKRMEKWDYFDNSKIT